MTFESMPIESVQDYWNTRPCNIRHSDKQVGTVEYYNEIQSRKYFVEPHIPAFAGFDKWFGKKVLEIGCGIGTDTMMFARRGAIITAVDYSEESLRLAMNRAKAFEMQDKIRFYYANAEDLSKTVPIEEYDLIYSFGVIHHTPHPDKVISELKKYMGPQTVLKVMVYNRNSWKVLGIKLRHPLWPVDNAIAMNSEAQTGCPVTYTYTRRSVRKLLNGLQVTDMFVDHIFPYVVEIYKKYVYKKVWYFRILPKPLFRWLEKRLGWHLCVTAKLPDPS